MRFWELHEKELGKQLCPKFKDLMTHMLAYQPFQRLNLAEVIMHPYFLSDQVATNEETKLEMRSRKAALDQKV